MQQDPKRIPVIVGVGEVNDRPASDAEALNSLQLMLAALAAADGDSGGHWLERCERILVVPQLSFSEIDIPQGLAAATGLDTAAIRQPDMPSGDTPVRLLNDAANMVGAGEVTACAIVGAEAMRTALRSGKPLFPNSKKNATELRRRYGLFQPADIYPFTRTPVALPKGRRWRRARRRAARYGR